MTEFNSIMNVFESENPEFNRDYRKVIKNYVSDCQEERIEEVFKLLSGSLRWQAAALSAIKESCSKKLSEQQIDIIASFLNDKDAVSRIDATQIIRLHGTRAELILNALLQETNENVANSMISSYLNMNGVSGVDSVNLSTKIQRVNEKISKEILEKAIEENLNTNKSKS